MYIQFATGGGAIDGGNNYSRQVFSGNNTGSTIAQNISTAKLGPQINCANDIAGSAGTYGIEIPNYSGAVFNKVAIIHGMSITGGSLSGNLWMNNYNVYWANTGGITSILLGLNGGGNFIIGSTFTLYGE